MWVDYWGSGGWRGGGEGICIHIEGKCGRIIGGRVLYWPLSKIVWRGAAPSRPPFLRLCRLYIRIAVGVQTVKILIRLLLKSNLTWVCTVCPDTCLSQYFLLSWHVFIPETERNDFSVTIRNQHKVSNYVFNKFSL